MNNSGDASPAIPGWQQRMMAEHVDLEFKLERLRKFCRSGDFGVLDTDEMERLQRQAVAMAAYAQVLGERIAALVRKAA